MHLNKKHFKFKRHQQGVSLLEILIAVFITAIGVLGAAAMQLNALKYTDSSRITSQASFIIYDVLDRMRANSDAVNGYALANIAAAPATATNIQSRDLMDFATAVGQLPDGNGSITVNANNVTVTVSWSEQRAGGTEADGAAKRADISVTTDVVGVIMEPGA